MLELSKLEQILVEYRHLEEETQNPDIFQDQGRLKAVMQKKKKLEKIVSLIQRYKEVNHNLMGAKELISQEKDPELLSLAKSEIEENTLKIEQLEEEIKI